MAKKILILLCVLSVVSCTRIGPSYQVFKGNYKSRQGNYQHAEIDYLNALGQEDDNPWISYNQGNIYYSLGETESALEAWERSEAWKNQELQFRLSFNRGVLYYDLGNYNEAYKEFKQALLLKPGDLDSKINLELTLKKIGGSDKEPANHQEQADTLLDDTERLLYYVQSKEQYQWSDQRDNSPSYQQDW